MFVARFPHPVPVEVPVLAWTMFVEVVPAAVEKTELVPALPEEFPVTHH